MIKHIGEYVEVIKDDSYFSTDKAPKISWSSIGSVDIKIAEQFVKDLQEALTEAKKI
jgi:hypothetical protein